MNHIYKVVWNKAKHAYVITSEIAKTYTKSAGSRTGKLAAVLAAAAVLSLGFGIQGGVYAADDKYAESTVLGSGRTGNDDVNIRDESVTYTTVIDGTASTSNTQNQVVIGKGAQTANNDQVAIGVGAKLDGSAVGSVAIGTNSGVFWDTDKANYSVENVVSFGNSKEGLTRRLINIAAGVNANDAVNVSQLNSTVASAYTAGDGIELKENDDSESRSINVKGWNKDLDGVVQYDNAGTITGLTNTTFNIANYAQYKNSGRAATEGQLHDAFSWLNQKIDGISIKGDDNVTVTPGTGTGTGTETGSGTLDPNNPDSPSWNVGLNKDVDLSTDGSLTVGQTKVTNDGVTVGTNTSLNADRLTIGGQTYISKDGLNANGHTIANVGDGLVKEGSKEAVNGGQLYKEQQDRIAADNALGGQINNLGYSVNKLGGEIDSVGALSAALAGLHPLDYDASQSKYQLAAAVGGYDGAYALALGGFYNVNQDILLSGGVSTILKGDRKTAGNLGVTFRVGAGNAGESLGAASDLNEANQRLAALSQENKVLAGQNRKLSDQVAAQDQKIAAQDEKLADLAAQVAALTKSAK